MFTQLNETMQTISSFPECPISNLLSELIFQVKGPRNNVARTNVCMKKGNSTCWKLPLIRQYLFD